MTSRLVAADCCSGHGATEPRSSPVRSPDATGSTRALVRDDWSAVAAEREVRSRPSGRSPSGSRMGVVARGDHRRHPCGRRRRVRARVRHRSSCATAALARRGGHSSLDPFVALTAAVAADPGIRVLTNLSVLGYRHPLVLAKSAATLDRISGGRLTLGVGVGYLAAEFDALGVSFDERNDRFDHALDVLDAVARAGGRDHRGRWPDLGRASRSATGPAADPDLDWWQCRTDSSASRRTGAGVDADAESGCVRKDHEIAGPRRSRGPLPLHRRPASSGR